MRMSAGYLITATVEARWLVGLFQFVDTTGRIQWETRNALSDPDRGQVAISLADRGRVTGTVLTSGFRMTAKQAGRQC